MSDKRQKNQLVLAFADTIRSEAPRSSAEATESIAAKREAESPASIEQLMELDGKGVHREVEFEGSRRQNAGLTNRNRISGVQVG